MITIRQLSTATVQEVASLFNDYRKFYNQESDVDACKTYLKNRQENNESVVFAIYSDGEVAGFTQLYPSFSSVGLKKIWILNDLYIAKSYRTKGLGRKLIEYVAQFAKADNAVEVQLSTGKDNVKAQSLYEAIGFTQWEETEYYNYKLSV